MAMRFPAQTMTSLLSGIRARQEQVILQQPREIPPPPPPPASFTVVRGALFARYVVGGVFVCVCLVVVFRLIVYIYVW